MNIVQYKNIGDLNIFFENQEFEFVSMFKYIGVKIRTKLG